jgi:hypothetical protein
MTTPTPPAITGERLAEPVSAEDLAAFIAFLDGADIGPMMITALAIARELLAARSTIARLEAESALIRESLADAIKGRAAVCEANARLLDERDEARKALRFYADPLRYQGGNQRPLPGDEFTPAGFYYRIDVTRDGGAIARAALKEPAND